MSDAFISQLLALSPLVLLGVGGIVILALAAWRPAFGCAIFVFMTPLTTGLVRGSVVPLLRANEALLVILVAGLIVHRLHRPHGPRPLTMLDLAVGTYAIGVVLISFLVLFISTPSVLANVNTLRDVLSPAQFLLVYAVFSRSALSGRELSAVLNAAMLASLVVAGVAVVELVNLGGVRALVTSYFPPIGPPSPWDPVYRPASTLGHYSAVGAFAVLNYVLALALLAVRHPAFSRLWLSLVMAANLVGLVASLTWAPLLVLPLVTGVILWRAGRVPREFVLTLAVLALAFAVLWPSVSARSAQQGVYGSTGLTIPHTFVYRMQLWDAFFIPAFAAHLWLGTGTVLPSLVPAHLVTYVDNEYLREGFRAGLVGIAFLLTMHATVALVGWRSRGSPDPVRRAVGSACLALVPFFVLCGLVGEYLFFAGVSQEYAMLIGVAGALWWQAAAREPRPRLGRSTSFAGAAA